MSTQRMREGWARFNRLRRRLGFDRNRLRRRIDRVQWAIGLAMLVVFLATAPVVTTMAVHRVYASGISAERSDAAERARAATRPPTTEDRTAASSTGRSAEQPRTHTDTVADSAFAGFIAATSTGVLFLTGYLLVRRRIDRRRAAAWDAEWTQFDRRPTA